MITVYEKIVTQRDTSIFSEDINKSKERLSSQISDSIIVVLGAAGSIGAAVVKLLAQYNPKELIAVDLSENGLVELTRDLRSSSINLNRLTIVPIGLGSREFDHYFASLPNVDYVLNLSAMKHVRSEKDPFCIARMIDTNILFIDEFLKKFGSKIKRFFSVSSDKAVNPANLMGATKMLMEETMLLHQDKCEVSSARFANVAFSSGSLLDGFLYRLQKKQPLAGPSDVVRFFIAAQEAAELCLISCFCCESGDVVFPNLTQGLDEKSFKEIAIDFLKHNGYEPYFCESDEEAKNCSDELINQKKWPCYFTSSDTSGEKMYEEFFHEEDNLDTKSFSHIGIVKSQLGEKNKDSLIGFLNFCREARLSSISKQQYVEQFEKVLPTLKHIETCKNLDQKM